MNSKKLPLTPPLINGYTLHSYILSVIGDTDDYLPWFYLNYTQLFYNPYNPSYFNFLFNKPAFLEWVDYELLHTDTVLQNNMDLIKYLINSINNGMYTLMEVNEFHIPGRKNYHSQDFDHLCMFYGYNEDEQSFDIIGFDQNMEYKSTKVGFQDFQNSFRSLSKNSEIFSFKKNQKYRYDFDLDTYIEILKDYLYSRNTTERYRMVLQPLWNENYRFGLETYTALIALFNSILENKPMHDVRPLHILWEHKICLSHCLKYLQKTGYLRDAGNIIPAYAELESDALSCRNMFLKWLIIKDNKIIVRLMDFLKNLMEREQKILSEVLNRLKPL